MSPLEARAAYDASTSALDIPGPPLSVEATSFRSRDGSPVAAHLYREPSGASPQAVLLYFHGGGYVLGGLHSHDSLCRHLAASAGCAVLAIDYRLAPEHRFPIAFEDAEDANIWLLENGPRFGLDTQRIAFGGDSVGGTLAAALTIAARDAGRPPPVLQLLIYPCTSAFQDSASHLRNGHGFLLERETLHWMFEHYLRSAADRSDFRFAPLESADLSKLAAAHLVLAEFDPLLDEGLAYAERLRAAGVPVSVVTYPGMVHDFLRLGNVTEHADRARDEIARVLARAFA